MSTAIEVSAAAYWSLRLDRDFDLFCAVKDGASFTLHSESEEADAEGEPFYIVESTMTYDRASVPGPMQGMLKKDEPFCAWSRFVFYADKFDEGHLATFETRPSILGDKLIISGDCWCEPSEGGRACILHTRHTVSCKVFGVGGVIENTILSQIKASYKTLSAGTLEYMATDAYANFCRKRGGTGDAEASAEAEEAPSAAEAAAVGHCVRGSFSESTDVRGSLALSAMDRVWDDLRASLSGEEEIAAALHGEQHVEAAASAASVRASPPVRLSGWLGKRGEVNTTVRRRYFVLEPDGTLAWFAKPPPAGVVIFGAESGKELLHSLWAHGRVSVRHAHVEAVGTTAMSVRLSGAVRRTSVGAAISHLPASSGGRVLSLAADSEAERDEWVQALSAHAERTSGAEGGEAADPSVPVG